LDERAVLPNMMAEFGAKNSYLPPDQAIFDYLEAKRTRDYTPLYPDPDADYVQRYSVDLDTLQPQIALPHSPANVTDLSEALGLPIQQAFLGTCTNGRLEDLAAAAEVLRGHKIACRMVVIPASSQVMLAATKAGYIETLLEAGATVSTPGCGPCMGNHMGVPAPDEATISSANRNFNGRMGTPGAPTYLSSPYVVAASAIRGVISDPGEFLS
jgi:homoaconitase/3-isopropylmalate dehydratase large subunit